MIFKYSHRVFHPWVERGVQKLNPSILSIPRHFTEENLIATSTNSRQMFLKSKMVKCLQTEIARISNMVLILQKLSWDSNAATLARFFWLWRQRRRRGGWYNKVQTEMYKWDPEVCGFGLSPKRAENVIQINISTLRKEVGKVNKQRWIDYTQAHEWRFLNDIQPTGREKVLCFNLSHIELLSNLL